VTREELAARTPQRIGSSTFLANLSGALVVYVFLSFLLTTPVDLQDADGVRRINTAAFVVYMALTAVGGRLIGLRMNSRALGWLRGSAPAEPGDRIAALRVPLRMSLMSGGFWAFAAVLFGALNATYSGVLAVQVVSTVALGGVTTTALAYLLAERVMRPVVTLAQDSSPDPPPVVLSVTRRMVLAWAVGSGVPLLGIALGYLQLASDEPLSPAGVLFLVGCGLVVGLLATVAAARAVADPVQSVASALRDVGEGRLDVAVPVYDASEVGRLQAGFNAMAEGLRERARLQDLFGRQVGTDVARLALERGVRLGGERRDVAVLFVDVIGSTALAVSRDPEDVVLQLNAFFSVVVDAVAERGGWVNKFEGDAALCVFGAPADRADAGACALAAARALARGLEPLELDAAIGVSAGPVVAGNVGTESRFEYTVIGDPVNTAARLAERARSSPGHVLADGAVVDRAGEEAAEWELGEEVVLRGRSTPTCLARPRPMPPSTA
jgi:adenylate cyclase